MPQSFASLHCHIVFSTKGRVPWITTDIRDRLYSYIGGILRAQNSPLVAAGGMPDHVHLLVSLGRELCVSDALRLVKANSSRWVHETFPSLGDFTWQTGYGAFAVSYSLLDQVKDYLARQEEHHRQQTFQDEFRSLLRRHEIHFEEPHVWD